MEIGDIRRIVNDVLDVALRYVPEENQQLLLRDLRAADRLAPAMPADFIEASARDDVDDDGSRRRDEDVWRISPATARRGLRRRRPRLAAVEAHAVLLSDEDRTNRRLGGSPV